MAIVTILGSVALGIALAASTGLRAFLPLFVTGFAARLGVIELGEAFSWLEGTPALVALGTGVVLELSSDKVPWLHHLLDVLHTPVRTVAGILVCAATVVDLPPWIVALLAIIVGGGVALSVALVRMGLRATSSAATGGASAPAHSLAEDVVCVAAAVSSVLSWMVALVVAVAAVALLWWSGQALWRRLS